MKDNNDKELEEKKIDDKKKEEHAEEVLKKELKEVEDTFVFSNKVQDLEREPQAKRDINTKWTVLVIVVSVMLAALGFMSRYFVYGLPITIVYSIIGNFYLKWKIKNSTENLALLKGLKKGFFIYLCMVLIFVVGLILIMGSCMLMFI